jgi:hypothetical protein
VWWDHEILPGTSYERVIEAEIAAARCVVVLWSAAARQSNWVRDEATLALSRNVLVSVLLDDSEPPLGFRQQQTANLAHWNGSSTDPAFATLKQGIANIIGRGTGVGRGTRSTAPARIATRRSASWPVMVAALVIVLALIGAALWALSGGRDRNGSSAPAADQRRTSEPEPREADATNRAGPSSQALIVPAQPSVTLPRERVTFTILSGTLDRVNTDTRLLTLHIRVSNNGTSFYRTYYSNLRLVVGDVPRAPSDAPLEQVDAASARELDYRFELPATATRAVLRVLHNDQTGEIPLELVSRGR